MLEYVPGNRLVLLHNGEQYFPELTRAIDGARHEIFLETYLFADDQTGSLVADALSRAAARGVAVQLLLDGFGARDLAPRFREMLERAGAKVQVYRPNVSPWTLRRSRLRRLHRKIVCVDDTVAFVGGINIIDDFHTPRQTPPRFDYAVRIEGPVVERVREAAARLWALTAWANFRKRVTDRTGAFGMRRNHLPRWSAPAGDQRAALVVRDNLRHRRDIEEAYLSLIGSARREILIANSYFFPGRRFRHALVSAAARGVHVTLLLQGRVEYALLHYASRALYGSLLDAGVEIHEYHRSFLHAKVAVFDGRQACVGSSNIDPFSLLLAREANLFVDDAAFAAELRGNLIEAMRLGAQPVPPRQWKRKPLRLRVRIWLAYALARLFIAMAGVDRYH